MTFVSAFWIDYHVHRYDPLAAAIAAVAKASAPPSGFTAESGYNSDASNDPSDDSDSDTDDEILQLEAKQAAKKKLRTMARRLANNQLLKPVKAVRFSRPSLDTATVHTATATTTTTSAKSSDRSGTNNAVDARTMTWEGGHGAPAALSMLPAHIQRHQKTTRLRAISKPTLSIDRKASTSSASPSPTTTEQYYYDQRKDGNNGTTSPATINTTTASTGEGGEAKPSSYRPHSKAELDRKWTAKFEESRRRLAPEPAMVPFNKGVFGVKAQKKPIVTKPLVARPERT